VATVKPRIHLVPPGNRIAVWDPTTQRYIIRGVAFKLMKNDEYERLWPVLGKNDYPDHQAGPRGGWVHATCRGGPLAGKRNVTVLSALETIALTRALSM